MLKNLIILGTSGLAKEMAMLADHINRQTNQWDILGFIGEPGCKIGQNLGIGTILGDDSWLLSQSFKSDLIIGIGYPRIKKKVLSLYLPESELFEFPNLIHPSSIFDAHHVIIGKGNMITAGCVFTSDISIGDFNLFNLNTTVGHDVKIGNYNVFNPGVNISGGVRVEHNVLIGTGAQILENLHIQSNSTVGAGAVVIKDVLKNQVVVGVPAKHIKDNPV